MGSAALLLMLAALGGTAPAAETASNVRVSIAVGSAVRNIPRYRNGESAMINHLAFKGGFTVESAGPDAAIVRVRFELPAGLHWGTDVPDSSENCTSTATVAECRTPQPLFTVAPGIDWVWDVVADAPGSYVLRSEVIESSTPDPDPSDNAASVTVNVAPATVAATAVQISPRRPRAGSTVTARVRVTLDGQPATLDAVRCIASIGAKRLKSSGTSSSGSVTCRFRTPKSAKGKTLRGTVAFSAGGTQFRKTFAAKLR